jgi:hypothetical protein
MGTVVGAIAVWFLCRGTPVARLIPGTGASPVASEPSDTYTFKLETSRSPAAGPPRTHAIKVEASSSSAAGLTPTDTNLDFTHLTVLAVCGLVYCYIASAPILVFHAGRFLFTPRRMKASRMRWKDCYSRSSRWVKWLLVVLLVALSPVGPLLVYATLGRLENSHYCIIWYFALAALLVIVLQYIVCWKALIESGELFAFYRKLAQKREVALSPEKVQGGIVDSYRHLREHGNSFFIVLLEVLLASLLVCTKAIVPCNAGAALACLVVLVAWILPAAAVWEISTLFEHRFGERYNGKRGIAP